MATSSASAAAPCGSPIASCNSPKINKSNVGYGLPAGVRYWRGYFHGAEMNRLSVCLVAQNEQDNLPRVLRSVAGIADEVVVVDGGSTDQTQKVAGEAGAKVFR